MVPVAGVVVPQREDRKMSDAQADEEEVQILGSQPASNPRKRWHFEAKKEYWEAILQMLDNEDEGPWESKNKADAWSAFAIKVNLQEWASGYNISARAIEKWFNALIRIDEQVFLGTFRRSGEGDGGPPPEVPEGLSEVFTSLKGKVAGVCEQPDQDKKMEKRKEVMRKGIQANGRLGAGSPEFEIDEEGEPIQRTKSRRKTPEFADSGILEFLNKSADRRAEASAQQTEILKQLLQNQMVLMQHLLRQDHLASPSLDLSQTF